MQGLGGLGGQSSLSEKHQVFYPLPDHTTLRLVKTILSEQWICLVRYDLLSTEPKSIWHCECTCNAWIPVSCWTIWRMGNLSAQSTTSPTPSWVLKRHLTSKRETRNLPTTRRNPCQESRNPVALATKRPRVRSIWIKVKWARPHLRQPG